MLTVTCFHQRNHKGERISFANWTNGPYFFQKKREREIYFFEGEKTEWTKFRTEEELFSFQRAYGELVLGRVHGTCRFDVSIHESRLHTRQLLAASSYYLYGESDWSEREREGRGHGDCVCAYDGTMISSIRRWILSCPLPHQDRHACLEAGCTARDRSIHPAPAITSSRVHLELCSLCYRWSFPSPTPTQT